MTKPLIEEVAIGGKASPSAVECHDFAATESWHVAVQVDDNVRLINDLGDGWLEVVSVSGKEGCVPASYLAAV